MKSRLDKDSLQEIFGDEIVSLLAATTIGSKCADYFQWRKSKSLRYPSIGKVACDILEIQASSMCSEECPSLGGRLVGDEKTELTDDSIASSVLVRAWNRLFRST